MSLKLPEPLAAYVAAENGGDVDALDHCFAEQAVVRDEGRTIQGLAAIKAWKAHTRQKYRHTVEPLSVVEEGGKTILTSRLTGTFPGSPIDLRFAFGLEDGKIVSLEIAP